jgi:hypothetical protein
MKTLIYFLSLLISFASFAQTGIGTTTPAVKLHVKSNGSIFRLEGSDHAYMELYPQGSSTRYGYLGYPGVSSSTLTLMNQFSTGALTFGTNNTTRMWLNSDGRVGLGTSSPSTSFHIENTNNFGSDPSNTTSPSLYILNTNNTSNSAHSTALIRTAGNGGGNPYLSFDIMGVRGYSMGIDNADSDKFKFYTNWNLNNSVAPAYTVTTDNRVGIGTDAPGSRLHIQTSDAQSLIVQSNVSDNNGMVVLNANTSNGWGSNWHEFVIFQNQGNYIGGIVNNGSSNINYGTSSDYRLKSDLRNFKGLDLINKIKTYDYAWKSDNTRMYGVMAHELQEVIPYIVSGEKDAVDGEGKIKPQVVDYSKLTPVLVKAMQEQDLKIKQLEERILQLEKLINKVSNNK